MALLKILHLLALVFGSAASLGNVYLGMAIQKSDLTSPGFTNRLRSYFRYTALIAILTLWVTGLPMLVWQYGGWVSGFAFTAKLVLAMILTAIIFYLNLMAGKWARSGGPPSYVPVLHWIGATSLVLIVVTATISFL